MARSATIVVENNFTGGLITEYSAMNFPENAVTECDNVVFSEMGKVTRRLGIDAEINHVEVDYSDLTDIDGAKVIYKWASVGQEGAVTFIVCQIGNRISFFENGDGAALSAGWKPFSINLLDYKTAGISDQQISENPCQMTSGKGYLFIVHPWCEPIYISYDHDTDSITANVILIQIRDFERLKDGLEISQRPPTLSPLHHYNLFNQGWYATIRYNSSGGPTANAIAAWQASKPSGVGYPSNTDVWWYYTDISQNTGREYFQGDQILNRQGFYGSSPAPTGHYIYNAFNMNRSLVSGISGVPTKTSNSARPSCVAFFAGRVFYAGVGADGYSDQIYFSQIAETEDKFGFCFQQNDPTSKEIFDLLASDGGVISVPTISEIVSMRVIKDSLVILGTNGIFVIRGSDNSTFKATDYKVEFSSNVGAIAHHNITEVDGSLIWMNYDAIYAFSSDQTGFSFVVENISKSTIQSLLDRIPTKNKQFIKVEYNRKDRIVQWLYQSDASAPNWTYNKILEFNVVSKAFYPFTINPVLAPRLLGVISVTGLAANTTAEVVTDNTFTTVTDSFGLSVTVENKDFIPSTEILKYATLWPNNQFAPSFTFSEFRNQNHLDFESFDNQGVPFPSQFVSGYRIRGEMLRKFNSTPIGVVLDTIDQGRCTIQGIWDYGFRTTSIQELYLTRPEPEYLIRKIKLRGKGKSLQLKFSSVGNANFSVVGWSTFDHGGQNP